MKNHIFTFIFLLNIYMVFSQETKHARPDLTYYLKLNSLADLKIDSWIMNAPTDKNLNGKFLVINFWTTDCVVCNAGMKKIEELKEEFSGINNLYFMNLTFEDSTKVIANFQKQKLSTNLMVVSDKRQISNLRTDAFKKITYPLSILVNGKGVIVFITFPNYLKKEYVHQLIENKLESFDAFYKIH